MLIKTRASTQTRDIFTKGTGREEQRITEGKWRQPKQERKNSKRKRNDRVKTRARSEAGRKGERREGEEGYEKERKGERERRRERERERSTSARHKRPFGGWRWRSSTPLGAPRQPCSRAPEKPTE